jgi:hypothetical protein
MYGSWNSKLASPEELRAREDGLSKVTLEGEDEQKARGNDSMSRNSETLEGCQG